MSEYSVEKVKKMIKSIFIFGSSPRRDTDLTFAP